MSKTMRIIVPPEDDGQSERSALVASLTHRVHLLREELHKAEQAREQDRRDALKFKLIRNAFLTGRGPEELALLVETLTIEDAPAVGGLRIHVP